MALTTESRTLLIAALTGNGYKVYDTVPAVPTTPSVCIVPDSPWIRPNRIGSNLNYEVRWRILVNVNARVNDSATTTTEDAIDTLLAQIPSTFQVDVVNAPQLLSLGAQGTVVSTEINVNISMKE
tara:strand:- start:3722 stop:4096 length:375 start_codon:yes stop_codon:yes gene_type:complete